MAPTPPVDVVEPTQPDESAPEVAPARVAPLERIHPTDAIQLPDPRDLLDRLAEQLEHGVAAAREGRTVTRPADTHELVRALVATGDRIRPYLDTFKALDARIQAEVTAELTAAVGRDRNGAPRENMDVPDDDGTTIKVTREWSTVHDIDRQQAVRANVAYVAHEWKQRGVQVTEDAEAFAAAAVDSVIETLLPSAAHTVKITGLEALAALLGERGLDDDSQIASDAYRSTTSTFKRAKVERSAPAGDKPAPRKRITRKRTTAS